MRCSRAPARPRKCIRLTRRAHVESDDLARAVDTLKPLGSGFAIINLGSRKVIQSVPFELSPDASILLKAAEVGRRHAAILRGEHPTRGDVLTLAATPL